jgi:hypothetical protein
MQSKARPSGKSQRGKRQSAASDNAGAHSLGDKEFFSKHRRTAQSRARMKAAGHACAGNSAAGDVSSTAPSDAYLMCFWKHVDLLAHRARAHPRSRCLVEKEGCAQPASVERCMLQARYLAGLVAR